MIGGSTRGWLGSIVGILGGIAVFQLLTNVADSFNLPFFIYYGETITVRRGPYDEEIDSATTALGYWIIITSIISGSWLGTAMYTKKLPLHNPQVATP